MLKHPRTTVEIVHMTGASWLCPTELDRSRVVDASDRVRMIRRVGSISVGVALVASAPWVGWWWTLPLFALTALNFANVERRIYSSAHPERVSATGVLITLALLTVGAAAYRGSANPFLPWMILPAAMIAARFRPQVVIAGVVLTVFCVLIATVGAHTATALKDPVPLFATLALLVSVVTIVRALQTAELHHRSEAILDPLTGLLNRNALAPRFVELSLQARLSNQPVCLVLCDVDNFKAINDQHGHDRGDAVLRDVAYTLRKQLRSFELIYRLGGEEFLVVLPGMDHSGGMEIAGRLREAVEQAQPTGIPVTVSLGLSDGCGEQVDYDVLFKAADEAMYAAKRAGRNRISVAGRLAPADAPGAPGAAVTDETDDTDGTDVSSIVGVLAAPAAGPVTAAGTALSVGAPGSS
jgi:diguanylate cyclase (GGDEF)-like protein